MKKASVIYNWFGVFSAGILMLYLEYIRYTQDSNLLFPGEPPFYTADSDFTFVVSLAVPLSNLCFFIVLLNILLLFFRQQKKMPGFYSSKLSYAAILLFEAAAAGLAFYQLITYGGWTICEAGLNTPLGKFSTLYLPAVIMTAAVLIIGIAQFFHEQKRWKAGFYPESERNRLQTEQAQNAANKESAVQTPGFGMNRKTALYSLIGVIICGAAAVYGAFFDYRFQNLLLFSGEGPYQWGRDPHTEASVPFIVLSNIALLLFILNGLLLFFYKTKRHTGFFTGRKPYYIMLAAEILLVGESIYRVIRYFSWTVAEIRTPGINTWYDSIMPIAPTLIPVLIFALALLILGILQFLSAKKNTSVKSYSRKK